MSTKEQDKSLKRSKVAIILGAVIVFGILATIIIWAVNANRTKKAENEQAQALEQLELDIENVQNSASEIKTQLESILPKLDVMDEYVNTNKQVVNGINSVSNVSSEFIDSVEKETISLQTVLDKYIKTYGKETSTANEIVANSFETVNKDINDLVTVINSNNNQQNSNYSSISNQLDKLLKDTKKFIQVLTEENVEQHKALIEEMTGYNDKLTESLNKEFANLNNQIISVDESLDTLSKRIKAAKESIIEAISEIDAGITKNLNDVYASINTEIEDLQTSFVATIELVEKSIVDLKTEDAERYAGVTASLETVNTNLSDLSKSTQSDLKLFKSSMDALIYTFQDNVNTFESTMGELFASASGDIDEIAGLLANANTDTAKIITDYFIASNQNITDKFASFNQNAADKFNEVEKAENDKIAGIQNEFEEKNKIINETLESVVDGKQLLIEALKRKNVDVSQFSDTPTFQEITDLVDSIPETIDPAVLPDVIAITDTFHHHTLGTIGDADNTSNEGGQYADDYISETAGGCFTKPVYHVHEGNWRDGGGCYTSSEPHKHIGSGDANGILVEDSCYESYQNREVVGSHWVQTGWYCGGCYYDPADNQWKYGWCPNCGTTHSSYCPCVQTGYDEYDYGYVTRYRLKCGYTEGQVVNSLGCGMTEETIIGYSCDCGLSDNQLVSKHLEY